MSGAAEVERDNYLVTRFGALCFFLSALEYIIPKPLPFLRLGISNVPLIIAAGFFSPAAYFLLALVKIAAQGALGGTFFSWIFLFSLAGTAMSAALMRLLKRALKGAVSAVGLSVAGALASNAAQLLIARAWIFGESASAIAPLLLGAGVICGVAVGVFAEFFTRKSLWLKEARQKAESGSPGLAGQQETVAAPVSRKQAAASVIRVAAGFASILLIGVFSSLAARAAAFVAFYAALCLAGKRPRFLPVAVSLLAITAFNLYPPRGAIIAEIAGFRVAAESLAQGASRALFFEALIFISRWTFLPGKFKLPRLVLDGKRKGRAARLLERVSRLLAETLELFGKLSSKPDKEKKRRSSSGRKLSLEGAALYIDGILRRIDSRDSVSSAKGE